MRGVRAVVVPVSKSAWAPLIHDEVLVVSAEDRVNRGTCVDLCHPEQSRERE